MAGRKKGKKTKPRVDDASDAVALATQARISDAASRGIGFRGGDSRLGVRRTTNQKKGQGGKKGSKRGEKRKKETW